MILSVTIHPLLEKRLTYPRIRKGLSHRNPVEEFKPGGKGINVCRQLNKFQIKNLAFTFLGGNNGKILNHYLMMKELVILSFKQKMKHVTR